MESTKKIVMQKNNTMNQWDSICLCKCLSFSVQWKLNKLCQNCSSSGVLMGINDWQKGLRVCELATQMDVTELSQNEWGQWSHILEQCVWVTFCSFVIPSLLTWTPSLSDIWTLAFSHHNMREQLEWKFPHYGNTSKPHLIALGMWDQCSDTIVQSFFVVNLAHELGNWFWQQCWIENPIVKTMQTNAKLMENHGRKSSKTKWVFWLSLQFAGHPSILCEKFLFDLSLGEKKLMCLVKLVFHSNFFQRFCMKVLVDQFSVVKLGKTQKQQKHFNQAHLTKKTHAHFWRSLKINASHVIAQKFHDCWGSWVDLCVCWKIQKNHFVICAMHLHPEFCNRICKICIAQRTFSGAIPGMLIFSMSSGNSLPFQCTSRKTHTWGLMKNLTNWTYVSLR